MDSIRLVVIRKPDNSKHDGLGEEEVDVDIGNKVSLRSQPLRVGAKERLLVPRM